MLGVRLRMTPSQLSRAVVFVLLAWLSAACMNRDARHEPGANKAQPAPASAGAPSQGGSNTPLSADRALRIRTETTMRSSDVDGAVRSLRSAVSDAGGYVSELRTTGTENHRGAELEARVPVAKLAGFRSGLAQLGEILADQETAEDVTEQRADLGARLRNARAQEQRLLDLLSDRTGSLADVIAAEKALSEARETIERLEAQSKALEGQIAFATVRIVIHPALAIASPGPAARIGEAASQGVELVGELAVGLVVLAAMLGPSALALAALGLVGFFVVRALTRRFGTRRPNQAA